MSRRSPDENKVIEHHGLLVRIFTWVDDTEDEWDGDQPLDPGCTGHDILVEVELDRDAPGFKEQFKASSSLCNTWVDLQADDGKEYLQNQIQQVTNDALSQLEEEISAVANGRDVTEAKRRQRAAKKLSDQLVVGWALCS